MIGKFYRNFNIRLVSKIINAKYDEKVLKNAGINRILTQSVYTKPGDAIIVGPWYSARKTIEEALVKGATVVFCEEKYKNEYFDNRLVVIEEPLACIEKLAKYCEKDSKAKRITITGSVGKTTTTGLINSIMDSEFETLTTHPMSNSHGAILRHFQQLNPTYEYWVQEVGGVQPGYIECSAKMLKSDIVVLTNIGISHMDKYGSVEGIFNDKSSLERYAKDDAVVVLNYDDEVLKKAEYNHNIIRFGINEENVDYKAKNIKQKKDGIEFDVICKYGAERVKLNLYGKYNVYNALAAIAVGCYVGVSLKKIIEDLKKYVPTGMRQNMQHIAGHTLLIDCFNAEPKTVLGSAQTLSEMIIEENGGRKIFVTGHIDKIGEKSAELHKRLGIELAKLNLDIILLYAGDSKYTYEGLVEAGYKNAILMENRDDLDQWLRENITSKDITFYKSGQFEAALIKTIDHVYGTNFQNEQQFNEGTVVNEGSYSYKIRRDDIVELVKYNGNDENPKIVDKLAQGNVIRIGVAAFSKNNSIKKITIPKSIENIGREAFYLCRELKEIKFKNGVKYISRSAFNYCSNLTEINLPDSVLHIDTRAFRDCVKLKKIRIPESVGYIGKEAFYNCPSLIIKCKKGSYAEQYAIKNEISYDNEI